MLKVALGEISTSINYGVTASACARPIGPKFLRITDIQNGLVDWNAVPWCECSDKESELARLKNGDIVFARTGATTGKSFLITNCTEKAVFASYLIRVRLKEIADSSYISCFFQSENYWAQIKQNARGAAQPGVNASILKRLDVPLPPLTEQKRIAAILDAADALRAKRRESIAQLDSLLQSTFLQMFGDPVTNPMGWDSMPLGDVIKVKSGNGLVAKNMAPNGLYPVYGGNGINGYHDKYMFEEPRIVLGRVGAYCGAVHLTPSKSWITDNALYVDKVLKEIQQVYLLEALRFANLNQYAGRAAQPLISGSRIYPVRILLPAFNLQQRFATIAESIEHQKSRLRTHLAELDSLFASLQSRAFNGEL